MSGILFFIFASCEPLNSSFPLILAKKKIGPTTFHVGRVSFQSWEVGGWCDPVILKLGYFENNWSDVQSKLCLQFKIVIF